MSAKTKFEITVDKKGDFRWKLITRNGEVVANGGEPFKSKASAMNAVKKLAIWAVTDDVVVNDPAAKKAEAAKAAVAKSAAKSAPAAKSVAKKVAPKKSPATKKLSPISE